MLEDFKKNGLPWSDLLFYHVEQFVRSLPDGSVIVQLGGNLGIALAYLSFCQDKNNLKLIWVDEFKSTNGREIDCLPDEKIAQLKEEYSSRIHNFGLGHLFLGLEATPVENWLRHRPSLNYSLVYIATNEWLRARHTRLALNFVSNAGFVLCDGYDPNAKGNIGAALDKLYLPNAGHWGKEGAFFMARP